MKEKQRMIEFLKHKLEWFLPVDKYGVNVKLKKNEIGRIFGCSIIFNSEYEEVKNEYTS